MKVKDIVHFLDGVAPFETALDFDNAGFLVGDGNAAVTGVTVALDCYNSVIDEAEKNGDNLIITHHPIIFDPVKNLYSDTPLYRLANKGIALISMHTNLDMAVGGVNDELCKKIGLKNIEFQNKVAENAFEFRTGELEKTLSADEFAYYLGVCLSVRMKYSVGKNPIKRVAVCSGSGGSMLTEVSALSVDAFVTADCKHSHFVDADRYGISLFDCGHFNTEDVIVEPLAQKLRDAFKDLNVHTSHYSNIKYIL